MSIALCFNLRRQSAVAVEGALPSLPVSSESDLYPEWDGIDTPLSFFSYPLPGSVPRPDQSSHFPRAARAAGRYRDKLILSVAEAAIARCELMQPRAINPVI
ncbi:MAG: hypothetical protein R2940_04365 [Syntrophotaleaceae bacterium]